MENNTHTCCVFPYQECKNHSDHPVTLLCTLSILWAQCPELDTAKSPLCWVKMEQSLTSLKNNSVVYASQFLVCLFHNMAFLTHTEFVLCCCPKNIFDGRVLARSSICKTWSFLSFSLSFSLFCRVWVWIFLPFVVLGWLFGWVFFWVGEGGGKGQWGDVSQVL